MTATAHPTGAELHIRAGGYHAIVAEDGATLRDLRHDGRALVAGDPPGELGASARGHVLIPWPNRIDRGRYRFAGETRQLDVTEPERDCAIHGLVRGERWTVAAHTGDRVVLTHRLDPHPGYPHMLDLELEYRLSEQGLAVRACATNAGDEPAPYAVGFHPYLTVGATTIDACELRVPAETWLATDHRGIPIAQEPVSGTPFDFRGEHVLGDLAIDHAFADLDRDRDGRTTVTLRDPASGAATSLWADRAFGWIQLYTDDHEPRRPRGGLAVEPMSCPPNGFASGIGVTVLQAGATHVATWGIAFETNQHPGAK